MGVSTKLFETFERQFIDLIADYQLISTSERQLREALRSEAARAETAEAARDAAERASADSRAAAAAATAGAAQAANALSVAQEEFVAVKMQLEFCENQRTLLEEKCAEMSIKVNSLEKELQILQPLQSAYCAIQRQFVELQGRIQNATEEAKSEASRLESELRRVERCAGAGSELRERARLAAAAHARERRLAAAELRQTTQELQTANAEIARLNFKLAESKSSLSSAESKKIDNLEYQALVEVRAALEAERAGTAKLERALAAALSDNATMAAELHRKDNMTEDKNPSPDYNPPTNICPIDSFLAE